MPENCEVCLTSQYLSSKIQKKQITNIEIISGRYKTIIPKGFNDFIKSLPLTITTIDSKGKFMWFELTDKNKKKYYILNTFGLTGKWSFKELEATRLTFTIEDSKNIYELHYDDVRNFGTLEFTNDKIKLDTKLNKLAIDGLKSEFTNEQFKEIVKKYKKKDKMLVHVLMDQTKTGGFISGIGNYLAPEIMYMAHLSPYRTVDSLTDTDINELANAIKYILKQCYINNKTPYISHLEIFLKTHLDKIKKGSFPNYYKDIKISKTPFEFKVYRQKKDPLGNDVLDDQIISGRTTYWVPKTQK